METDPLPEELVSPQPSRVSAIQETLTQRQEAYATAASSSAQSSADNITGQEAERYEQSSYTLSSTALLHNNAPRSRIGTARERFMTSNDRGQLMVGIVSDISLAAGQDLQNPGLAAQLAEEGFPDQPMVSIVAVEEEPASSLPDLDLAEDLEHGDDVVVPQQRSRRARRPSARALESLQLALELEQYTEPSPEKPKARKAARRSSSSKEYQGAQAEGSQGSPAPESDESADDSSGDDGLADILRAARVTQGGPESAQEVGLQAEAETTGAAEPTAPVVAPRMQRRIVIRPRAAAQVSSVVVNKQS